MRSFPSLDFANEVRSRTAELVPLLDIRLPDGAEGHISDRRFSVNAGGQERVYVRKLLRFGGITSDMKGSSGTASFTVSNVDRVMELAAKAHAFVRGEVSFKLFSIRSYFERGQSFEDSCFEVWAGYIASVSYDEKEFTLSCKDGLYSISLPLPKHRVSRNCPHEFDDGCFCPYSGYGYQQRRNPDGTVEEGDFVPIEELSGIAAYSAGETHVNGASDFGPAPDFAGTSVWGKEGWAARPGYTSCDKTFDSCYLRGMQRFFGGVRYVSSWAYAYRERHHVFFFRHYYTISAISDSVYGQAVPMVYCNRSELPVNPLTGEQPLTGFIMAPLLFSWRYEKNYIAAEGIVSLGRIGAASDSPYTAQLAYGTRRGEDVLGIRNAYVNGLQPHDGQYPLYPGFGVYRSSGRIGEPPSLPVFSSFDPKNPQSSSNQIKVLPNGKQAWTSWDVIGGDLQQGEYWINPVTGQPEIPPVITFSRLAGVFARVYEEDAGINNPQAYQQASSSDQSKFGGQGAPDVRVRVDQGRYVWIYSSPSDRSYGPTSNPAFVVMDMLLESAGKKYAQISSHAELLDIQTFVDVASYCSEMVDNIVNPAYQAPRYRWSGALMDMRPAVDQIDAVLRDASAARVWRGKRLALKVIGAGHAQSDSAQRPAFQEFVNIIEGSFKLTVPQPRFNSLVLNYADMDFDFQKNTATVYSEAHQKFVGNGCRLELSSSQNLAGTPTTDQATRLGARMLKEEIGGATRTEWAQLREIELRSTVMMLDLEPGDITYVAHTLIPGGGGWFRVISWTLNEDYSVTFHLRTCVFSAYDDSVTGTSSVELAKFGYNPYIPGSGGVMYEPLPALAWSDDAEGSAAPGIRTVPGMGVLLRWLPYNLNTLVEGDAEDRERWNRLTLAVQIYRTPAVVLRRSASDADTTLYVKQVAGLPLPPFYMERVPNRPVQGEVERLSVEAVDPYNRTLTVVRGINSVTGAYSAGTLFAVRLYAGGFLGQDVTEESTAWVVDGPTADFAAGEYYRVNGEIVRVTSYVPSGSYGTLHVQRGMPNPFFPDEPYLPPQPHHKLSHIQNIHYLDQTPDFRQEQFGVRSVYEYIDGWTEDLVGAEISVAFSTTTTTTTTTT